MPRVKRGTVRRANRQKLAKLTKGYFLNKSKLYRFMKEAADKAGRYAYRDRRQRKRHFRALWITRLGAALRARGIHYNRFIPALIAAGIELNRKMLSELAISDPAAFDAVVEKTRPHLAK